MLKNLGKLKRFTESRLGGKNHPEGQILYYRKETALRKAKKGPEGNAGAKGKMGRKGEYYLGSILFVSVLGGNGVTGGEEKS